MEYGKEIWFVDDDRVFQFIVAKYLEGTAYQKDYKIFDDGDKALLELITRAKTGKALPSLIFLDLNMKYMEGWETLDFLTQSAEGCKVVIVTSSLSEKDRNRAKREPLVVDYMTKPIDRNQLLISIRLLLGRKTDGSAAS